MGLPGTREPHETNREVVKQVSKEMGEQFLFTEDMAAREGLYERFFELYDQLAPDEQQEVLSRMAGG